MIEANFFFAIINIVIKASNDVKLLGVTIDDKLDFKKHILSLCNKTNIYISCQPKIRKSMNIEQATLLSIIRAKNISDFIG